MTQGKQMSSQDRNFQEIAKKVRKRRILTATVLIVLAAIATLALWNYKDAGFHTKPSIIFSEETKTYGGGEYTVYYSLGFKHVFYESEYGRNYYERLMLWDQVDLNTTSLTGGQYQQMTAQIKAHYKNQHDGVAPFKKYFDAYSTFHASILDIKKDGDTLTLYMNGYLENYIEHGGDVYGRPFIGTDGSRVESITAYDPSYGTQNQIRMVVTAVLDGDNLIVNDINDFQNYEFGEKGSPDLYDTFPKPVARVMLTSEYVSEVLAEKALFRSCLDAVAHFGKPLAENKYLDYDAKRNKGKVIDITYKNQHLIAF